MKSIAARPIRAAVTARPATRSPDGPIRPRNPNGTRARMMDAIRLLFVCVFIFRSVFADGEHYRAF